MSKLYQTLTVNVLTGSSYWQKPQDTAKDAVLHAIRRTRNPADMFIYDVSYGEGNPRKIKLIKTILHPKEVHEDN